MKRTIKTNGNKSFFLNDGGVGQNLTALFLNFNTIFICSFISVNLVVHNYHKLEIFKTNNKSTEKYLQYFRDF